MGEPAKKYDIEPDIRPFEILKGGLDDDVESKQAKTSKSLNNLESSGNQPNTGSVEDQENNATNPSELWKNNFTGKSKKNLVRSGGKFGVLRLKKKGPLLAIIITLLGGGIGISGLLSSSLLLFQVKETFFSALDNATPALTTRTGKMLYNKFKTVRNSFTTYSDGKCGIACQFGSINEKMKTKLESSGFKLEVDEGTGLAKNRYILRSFEFSDGTKVTNGEDFSKAMKNTAKASEFSKTFNSKIFFLNSKFSSMLKSKFGLDKLPKINGDTEEETTASLRKSLGLEGDTAETDPSLKLKTDEEKLSAGKMKPVVDFVNTKAVELSKATDVIGKVCSAYNIAKGVTYATKTSKIAAFAAFAVAYLVSIDQLKAGDGNEAIAATIGDQFTAVDDSGKSLTDSDAYKLTTDGVMGSVSTESLKYSATLTPGLITLLGTLTSYISSSGKTTATAAHILCKSAGNIVLDVAATCSTEITTAITTGIETGGAGAVISLAICAGKQIVLPMVIGGVIGTALASVISTVASNDTPSLDENTKGQALGASLRTGTAQVLNGASASYGLKAGSSEEIQQYAIDTAAIKKQQDAIASYEAQNTPFDIYNQYSFLGSIVRNLGISSWASSSASLMSSIGNVLSIIPKSLANIFNSASADVNKKTATYAEGQCSDPTLSGMGIDADAFCNPSYVMSNEEMNADINTVVQYMIDNNYIDEETGEAKSVANNDYQNYLTYCANRVDPIGETSGAIEDDNYDWEIGTKCVENSTQLSNFRTYTMDKSINDTMDYKEVDSSNNKQDLAKKIIAKNKVTFVSGVKPTLEDIASGADADGGNCAININILKIIDAITDKYSITISDINRKCTGETLEDQGSSASSRHYNGNGSALDISSINGVAVDGREGEVVNVLNLAMPILSSAGALTTTSTVSRIGQSNCSGNSLTLSSNVTEFKDTCHHIHLDLPPASDPNLIYYDSF